MLPKINNVGDENASSTLFSSSLRSYVPRHKKSQNPFSKEWLSGVIDDVRNVREKEQLRVLQMQMLEIEKKSELYKYQKENMKVVRKILEDTLKRTIKDNMPSSIHEQFDHLTSNFTGSYRDTFDLTSEDKNAFDPLSYELLHSTDAAIRHFNPKYSQGEIDVKRRLRKVIVVTKKNDNDNSKNAKALDGEEGDLDDDLVDVDDEIGLSPEEMEAVMQQKLEEKRRLDDLHYAKEWIYEKKWYEFTLGVFMLNEEAKIRAASRIRRVLRYEKLLSTQFFFSFSKRAKNMKMFVERERASWNEKKKKSRKRKATLKGTAAAVGKLLKSKRGKSKAKKNGEKERRKSSKILKDEMQGADNEGGSKKLREKVKNNIMKSKRKTSSRSEENDKKKSESDARRNSKAKKEDRQSESAP